MSMIGKTLGHYTVSTLIGAGGMGEVYRAKDQKLGRDVAIKVLPEEFVNDAERVARFQREAKLLASVNHPNIASIYGLEEYEGIHFLVLELIEGDTLADRIKKGPIPGEMCLKLALQIAEALEAAHEKDVIHRDLKPANIKVTPDNKAKVLDFGLAKAFVSDQEEMILSDSPTISAAATRNGVILGTASYMSPEQAQGQTVDKRTDIWAFGCVLYEMLTGQSTFPGKNITDILAGVIRTDPEWGSLPANLHGRLREVLERCLQKEPHERYHDIADVRLDIQKVLADPGGVLAEPNAVLDSRTRLRTISLILAALIALAGLWYFILNPARRTGALPAANAKFTQLTFQSERELNPSLAPNGKTFVYASAASGNWDIYFQRVGGTNPINLTEESNADDSQPCFSPDGETIAFRSERQGGGIFVMGATGESVRRITDFGFHPRWSPDGREILCATVNFDRPESRPGDSRLWRVDVTSGKKQLIADIEAVEGSWSPNGYRIAFAGMREGGQRDICTIPATKGSVQESDLVAVTNDTYMDWSPMWSATGEHLYFASDRAGSMNLWRVAIDEQSGEVAGQPEPIRTPSPYSGQVSLSEDELRLIYVHQSSVTNLQKIAFDPETETAIGSPVWVTQGSRPLIVPHLSLDGRWFAFESPGKQVDLCAVDREGNRFRQITNDVDMNRRPRWSPDSRWIAFTSDRGGNYDIWAIKQDGSKYQQLTNTASFATHPIWSPDGQRIAYYDVPSNSFLVDVAKCLLEGAHPETPQPLPHLSNPGPSFAVWSWSRDGKWLAGCARQVGGEYSGIVTYSLESQRYDWVTDFGRSPEWLSDSRRILFDHNGTICLVDRESKQVREILKAGPVSLDSTIGHFGISEDDRMIYFIRDVSEADVWLMETE